MRAAIIALALLLCLQQARAATAHLIDCTTGTSVTGARILIGTYEYAGQRFARAWLYDGIGTCPQTVEVF